MQNSKRGVALAGHLQHTGAIKMTRLDIENYIIAAAAGIILGAMLALSI